MRFSAQLASSLAALLLLVPMYFLGKELFGRQVGFWGALLFQYFPVSGHHLSDGISEALFLFLVAMALWRGVVAVRRYQPREFAWCGLWGGLAYLTRPEGALVVLALGLVLVGMQLVARSRRGWPKFWACGLSLGGAAAAVGSIYVLTTGCITNKPAAQNIGFRFVSNTAKEPSLNEPAVVRGPLTASVLGVFFKRTDQLSLRIGRSLGAMGAEFGQGFHYFGWIPALVGLAWGWRALRCDPRFWVVAAYWLFHAVILFLLAMVEFYVSDRHMMPLVMCGTFFMVAGIGVMASWLLSLLASRRAPRTPAAMPLASVLLGVLCLVCLAKAGQRLHGNRVGNHQAGLWLAKQLAPGDVVEDDHAYSMYYAGLVFEEDKHPVYPRDLQATCYVVLTRAKDADLGSERAAQEQKLRAEARAVYHWPETTALDQARVVIYSQPRDFEKHRWTVAP